VRAHFGTIILYGAVLTTAQLASILMAVLVGAVLFLSSRYSYLGKMCYIAGRYPLGARSVGVPVNRVYIGIFMLSAGLAGLAGGLISTFQPASPTLGLEFLIVVILVALAARTSIVMCTVLGFLYGITQSVLNYYASPTVAAVLPLVMFLLVIILEPRLNFTWRDVRRMLRFRVRGMRPGGDHA